LNQLWVRLSLAFAAVVLIASVLMLVIAFLIGGSRRSMLTQQIEAPGGLADVLAEHYRTEGSWAGSEPVLAGARSFALPWARDGLTLVLRDAEGRAVNGLSTEGGMPAGGRGGTGFPLPQAPISVPIRVDGALVGWLEAVAVPGAGTVGGPGSGTDSGLIDGADGGPNGEAQRDALDGPRDLLILVALVGGGLGLLFGVAVSRGLTAPLDRLAEAARAIGAGDLGQRVEVGGSRELAAVATSFNNMAASLEQAETLRRNLVADVAHELRTPLSVLQVNLQAILDGVYPLERAEIARLYDQSRLLARLVDDLHELAQAEAGQLPLHRETTDLVALARFTAATFTPVAEAQGVRLDLELPEQLSAVSVDPGRIAQVLHNLLSNAVSHSPAGGVVTLSAEAMGADVVLTVHDTGEGIAAEDLPRVFDRFYRADRSRSRQRGGAGLGLAIARSLVVAHGGSLTVTSEGIPGRGSTATVRLVAGG
jgi:two-component system OmpR family sensor kinase